MKEMESITTPASLKQKSCLYQRLLQCLEEEWQALINSQEEVILALALRKEGILEQLAVLQPAQEEPDPESSEAQSLNLLKEEVARAQVRNQRLIAAALEVIQDFWGHLNPASPGLYQAAGKEEPAPGNSWFHRQV